MASLIEMQIEALMKPRAPSTLSVEALTQIAEVERIVGEVEEYIKAANLYAGRAPTPNHYWVTRSNENATKPLVG